MILTHQFWQLFVFHWQTHKQTRKTWEDIVSMKATTVVKDAEKPSSDPFSTCTWSISDEKLDSEAGRARILDSKMQNRGKQMFSHIWESS